MRSFFFIACSICAFFGIQNLRAQNNWAFSFQYGFIAAHTPKMAALIQGHSEAIQLSYVLPTCGNALWQQKYRFPNHRLEAFALTTGNPRQLGYQAAALYAIELPLSGNNWNASHDGPTFQDLSTKGIRQSLAIGLGTGYSTKIWDLRENHQAAVLSSHFNIAVLIQYRTYFFITRKTRCFGGVRLLHLSNAASSVPNLGTNNLSIFVGLQSNHQKRITVYPERPFTPQWLLSVSMTGGVKEIDPPGSAKRGVFVLSIFGERHSTFKSSFGAGIDFMYNTSIGNLIANRAQMIGTIEKPDFDQIWQLGATAGYGLSFGDFQFRILQGVYLRDRWKDDGALYQRLSVRYQFHHRYFAQIGLKTHFAKADFAEGGIGVTLH